MRVPKPLLCLLLLGGCDRRGGVRPEPSAATLDAGATTVVAPASAPASAAPKAVSTGACAPEPKGGVVIPDSARATDIRIAAAGSKALVTFWESTKRGDGPNPPPNDDRALGYVFDASASSLGPMTKFEENDVGDEPVSAAAPVAVAADLFAISCAWAAPSGRYGCSRTSPGAKGTTLFDFAGISNGGPEKPDIAAVVKDAETLVVVPVGAGLQLFSASVSAKKKDSPFADHGPAAAPDAIAATLSAADEVTVVYRQAGALEARRAGFDQKWRGPAIDLSPKGMLVGAPSVASDSGQVTALFSERAKATVPWKLVLASVSASGAVKRVDLALPGAPEQAQGPGITKTAETGCFQISWVEGAGKTTRTKLARACGGVIAAPSVTTLSSEDVEGGRAYLATSSTDPSALFVAWQEIPRGKPPALRVAKLGCR